MIAELKSNEHSVNEVGAETQLMGYLDIMEENGYKKVLGILYNGEEYRIWVDGVEVQKIPEEMPTLDEMFSSYYPVVIDQSQMYKITKRINDNLHFHFGVSNLYQRMILTACFLIAKNDGAYLNEQMPYASLQGAVRSKLQDLLENDDKKVILLELFDAIQMDKVAKQEDIKNFLDCVVELDELFNEESWRGEDLMGIFYNEFYRYENKSQNGQVLTPHQTLEFVLESLDISSDDIILDATCGTGGFLSLAMYFMLSDAGGIHSTKADNIKSQQLYGLDNDKTMVALSTVTMLIHKDGKSNIHFMDATSKEAGEKIKEIAPTKVPMNPPYEEAYGCSKIVKNVLNNVPKGCQCAFILPDRKFCVKDKVIKDLMKRHHLDKIIKLPENTFNAGVNTSIFYFTAGKPQNSDKIFTCYMEDDGLCTVKNEARQDLYHRWTEVKRYWLEVLRTMESNDPTAKWIDPEEDEICYPIEVEIEPLAMSDFYATAQQYIYFVDNVDENVLKGNLMTAIMETDVNNIKRDGNRLDITVYDASDDNEVIDDAE